MNAPVVLFVYNRVDHVEQTLSALAENNIANKSELYIFSDGPKKENDEKVMAVRKLISDEKWSQCFKQVSVIASDKNKGLANSIITGVDTIIRKYGRVIVIEDDCVSSPDFLSFMNDCLDFYERNNKIWSIGGYSFDISFPPDYSKDVYFMGRTCSYAWATWLNRWEKVDWNVSDYNDFKFNLWRRHQFNEYGMDRSKMLDEQQLGMKNSWAIRFCYAMFSNSMLTVYPKKTRIRNIGYNEGTHVNSNKSGSELFDVRISKESIPYVLSNEIEINTEIKKQFVGHFRRNRLKLFLAFVSNVMLRIKR